MAVQKNEAANKAPELRTGDTVQVLHGKDAGKRGKVERVLRNPVGRKFGRSFFRKVSPHPVSVIISGVNISKRHTRPTSKMGSDRAPKVQQGGIVDKPMPIPSSNVMIVCPHCDQVTRVKHATLSTGKSARVCGRCREQLEVTA
jgi:large subunit ribosomal protein L24